MFSILRSFNNFNFIWHLKIIKVVSTSRSVTQFQIREITIREISATTVTTNDIAEEDSGFGEATHEEIAQFLNFMKGKTKKSYSVFYVSLFLFLDDTSNKNLINMNTKPQKRKVCRFVSTWLVIQILINISYNC